MRIGTATLAIIVLPICMNSAGEKSSSERVSVNHVPQNTPVTSMISIMVMNVIEFCLTLQSNGCDRHAASLARPVNKQLPAKMQNLPVNCLYRESICTPSTTKTLLTTASVCLGTCRDRFQLYYGYEVRDRFFVAWSLY